MNENPYAPPKAAVSDVVEAEEPQARPQQIGLAIKLAVGSYVLGLLPLVLFWSTYYSKLMSVPSLIANQLFSVGLLAWIYYKIWTGRNWARFLLLGFNILGSLAMLSTAARAVLFAQPALGKATMLINYGASIAILWLLFFSPGRVWFRSEPR